MLRKVQLIRLIIQVGEMLDCDLEGQVRHLTERKKTNSAGKKAIYSLVIVSQATAAVEDDPSLFWVFTPGASPFFLKNTPTNLFWKKIFILQALLKNQAPKELMAKR